MQITFSPNEEKKFHLLNNTGAFSANHFQIDFLPNSDTKDNITKLFEVTIVDTNFDTTLKKRFPNFGFPESYFEDCSPEILFTNFRIKLVNTDNETQVEVICQYKPSGAEKPFLLQFEETK
ncbi:MAG: hypothetical protein ACK5ZX_05690 [Bacteroidota bacterium]